MTWGDLEQTIDTSDLSRRNRTVLKAFSTHVNPPTLKRPYPENCDTWPSMATLMDATRYSVDTIQRAKHELLTHGILELVAPACRGPGGKGRSPRYRINAQKLQRDDAAWERQMARRARRQKGPHPTGSEPEKGPQNTDPWPEKGSAKCPPEFSRSSKTPHPSHFPGGDNGEHKKDAIAPQTNDETVPTPSPSPSTLTPAPDTFPLTEALRTWAAAPDQRSSASPCGYPPKKSRGQPPG
jgi:hypothetical protein